MTQTMQLNLANEIADTKAEIEAATLDLKIMTDKLIELVGEEGATFATDLGAVQVTSKTTDRTTSDIVTTFDLDKFLAMDANTQLRIRNLGIVKQERKVVKGQAPKVVVRLNK